MRLRVEIEIEKPDGVTDKQIQEWLEFELGYRANLSADNPLIDESVTAHDISVDL